MGHLPKVSALTIQSTERLPTIKVAFTPQSGRRRRWERTLGNLRSLLAGDIIRSVTIERAGVLIIRSGRLALIERQWQGRRYWVIPGGGVEPGETVADAARREAEEELGVPVELGALRVRIDHREEGGSIQRQWYFDAAVRADDIRIAGPEKYSPDRGIYSAVWIGLDELDVEAIHPSAVAQLIAQYHGVWPAPLVEINET